MTPLLLLLALLAADVRPLSLHTICTTRWAADHRFVSVALRRQVFARDHVAWTARACCVVDHRVPRELGGADVMENLWVQTVADAHRKDVSENALHRAVCAGTVTLETAQGEMRRWRP